MPKRIIISLPIPLVEELDEEAKEKDLTRSAVIRNAIENRYK